MQDQVPNTSAGKKVKATITSPTGRRAFAPRGKPYSGAPLDRGITLMYRRNATSAGRWVLRAAGTNGAAYWYDSFADADDIGFAPANGVSILTHGQAVKKALELARTPEGVAVGKPMTVADALDAYGRDLQVRGRMTNNVRRVRYHLQGDPLLDKPVALLQPADLLRWRNRLVVEEGMKPATFNRTKMALRAALGFAASLDTRITNERSFRVGLKRLKEGSTARRAVMSDAEVLRIVAEAQAEGAAFALFVEGLAQTGARTSQLARINCSDLRGNNTLMVPASFKGNEQKQQVSRPVPIDETFALKLAAARAGRADDAPLFLNANGERWNKSDIGVRRRMFRDVVARAGLDPDRFTPYALRHSSICRALMAGVPMTIVTKLHDTSAEEIEAHYAAHIDDIADDIARRGVLRVKTGNVVTLHKA